MLLSCSKSAQARYICCVASCLYIKFFAKSANVLRLMVDDREHPGEEEQVARLQYLDIIAKRRWSGWKLNA